MNEFLERWTVREASGLFSAPRVGSYSLDEIHLYPYTFLNGVQQTTCVLVSLPLHFSTRRDKSVIFLAVSSFH